MNKQFAYADGRVIVIGNDGEDRITEYADNIEDLLIKENVVEKTEKELNNEKENLVNLLSLKKSLKTMYGLGIFIIAGFLAATIGLLTPIKGNPLVEWTAVTIFSTCITILEGIIIRNFVREYKRIKNEINSTEREIFSLTKKLVEEKSRLVRLEKSKTKEKEQEFAKTHSIANNTFTQINDSQIMDALELGLLSNDKVIVGGMTEATGDPSFKYRTGRSKVLKSKKK